MKTALFLCNKTDNMAEPWVKAGVECIMVDLQHPPGEHRDGLIIRVGADVLTWNPPAREYVAAFAFPPCTDLAVSGARWFRSKGLGRLINALTIVNRCEQICEGLKVPYFIENPVSVLSRYWDKPNHTFDPCDYAGYLDDPESEAYTKRTCLWTGGGFKMPEPAPVLAIHGSKMHLLPPSADRADLRSVTPLGFARAVYEANAPCGREAEDGE